MANLRRVIIILVFLLIVFITIPRAFNLALVVVFQTVLLLYLLSSWKKFKKTRQGKFATATAIDCLKITGIGDDLHNYELVLEFPLPDANYSCQIKYQIPSYSKPKLGKQYKVWLDEDDPQESIVMHQFGFFWVVNKVVIIVVFLGLFVIDYFLFNQIVHEGNV